MQQFFLTYLYHNFAKLILIKNVQETYSLI